MNTVLLTMGTKEKRNFKRRCGQELDLEWVMLRLLCLSIGGTILCYMGRIVLLYSIQSAKGVQADYQHQVFQKRTKRLIIFVILRKFLVFTVVIFRSFVSHTFLLMLIYSFIFFFVCP